jgi:hypothetical protein
MGRGLISPLLSKYEENPMGTDPTKEILLAYLNQVLSKEFPKLVGKMCKRFEILEDREALKKEIKELVYETSREIQDIFEAYAKGLEVSYFAFVKPISKEKE